MKYKLIKQAHIVNEGCIKVADVLIANNRIEKIANTISNKNAYEIKGDGLYLMPGMIDDQVHFREPGLTHKATIYSESRAAVAGGITSYMEMPNTIPNTLTLDLLEQKYQIAAENSLANYSFFMGINQNNLEEALKTNNEDVCGITDDGLYFNDDHGILANYPEYLEQLFAQSESLIALHCEDDSIIRNNLTKYQTEFGADIPMAYHPKIRSHEACYNASKRVIDIAKKHGNRLHLFHITTAQETELFDNTTPLNLKKITAEACIPHLWFNESYYNTLGSHIKWNPAVKSADDQAGLIKALLDNRLDIIATDHAPHTIEEKNGNYLKAMSGGPMVQHALYCLLELYHQNILSLEKIAEKTAHNVAEIYRMPERGYIREGYFADLVLIDLNQAWQVTPENTLYKCEWSPLNHQTFKSKIKNTFVNGHLVFDDGQIMSDQSGMRLKFSKNRL
jgi:dihydroorotase